MKWKERCKAISSLNATSWAVMKKGRDIERFSIQMFGRVSQLSTSKIIQKCDEHRF
jgi:hypothetical protein